MSANDGHFMEALDRAHTIEVMIEELLAEHPAVEDRPKDFGVAVRQLQDAASNLYQLIGRVIHERDNN